MQQYSNRRGATTQNLISGHTKITWVIHKLHRSFFMSHSSTITKGNLDTEKFLIAYTNTLFCFHMCVVGVSSGFLIFVLLFVFHKSREESRRLLLMETGDKVHLCFPSHSSFCLMNMMTPSCACPKSWTSIFVGKIQNYGLCTIQNHVANF